MSCVCNSRLRTAGQLAGFVEHFKGFTYATIKGAGHMVRVISSKPCSVVSRTESHMAGCVRLYRSATCGPKLMPSYTASPAGAVHPAGEGAVHDQPVCGWQAAMMPGIVACTGMRLLRRDSLERLLLSTAAASAPLIASAAGAASEQEQISTSC